MPVSPIQVVLPLVAALLAVAPSAVAALPPMASAEVPAGAGMAAALRSGDPNQALGHDLDLMPGPAADPGAGESRAVNP